MRTIATVKSLSLRKRTLGVRGIEHACKRKSRCPPRHQIHLAAFQRGCLSMRRRHKMAAAARAFAGDEDGDRQEIATTEPTLNVEGAQFEVCQVERSKSFIGKNVDAEKVQIFAGEIWQS